MNLSLNFKISGIRSLLTAHIWDGFLDILRSCLLQVKANEDIEKINEVIE
jgi:hypothetical protein